MEYQYLRPATEHLPEHMEHVVIYLVDAWHVAEPDGAVESAISTARAAPAAEAAAKKLLDEAEAAYEVAVEVCDTWTTDLVSVCSRGWL